MKKWMLSALVLLLTLSLGLTALAQAPEIPPPQREETIVLEGNEEKFLASQYTVPGGFSIWYAAADFEPLPLDKGLKLNLINNFLNAEVYLEMIPFVEALEETMGVYQEEGWQTVPTDPNRYILKDQPMPGFVASKDGQSAVVYHVTLASGQYLLTLRYPMEAAEGWGARMNHFALSIESVI